MSSCKTTSLLIASALFSPVVFAALSVMTTNTIQGSAPYLKINGSKVSDCEGLLWLKVNNDIYEPADAPNTSTTPIILPTSIAKFSDLKTIIPLGRSVNLSSIISNYAADDDGDGGFSATGTVDIKIEDDVGREITNLNDTINSCNAPYRITLSSTSGTLSTQYGDPNTNAFAAKSATYYVKPVVTTPASCYAQPNLAYNNSGMLRLEPWNILKGFYIEDINGLDKNFPRTGFNNAYFNLTLQGATAAQVIAGSGSIVKATDGRNDIKLKLTDDNGLLKVTLVGPSHATVAVVDGAHLPKTFKLKADVNGTLHTVYTFTLSKWFIAKPEDLTGADKAEDFCNSLPGYRMPSVAELTNANDDTYDWHFGLSGNTSGHYARQIGHGTKNPTAGHLVGDEKGGLFTEWGYTWKDYYTGSDFEDATYWAKELFAGTHQYNVRSNDGYVHYEFSTHNGYKAVCVIGG
ncbi:hypothetical protein RCS94_09095 [Orbaceae bacterium ac157xtp]